MILTPTPAEAALIEPLVQHYRNDLTGKRLIQTFLNSFLNYCKESQELQNAIHSMRSRMKDPEHLADKLVRKIRKCEHEGTKFELTQANLFTKINDLAGIRLLHLHTRQISEIDRSLKAILEEQPVVLIEGPSAKTWDDEYRALFRSYNIETQDSETMYTSVHYVVGSKSNTAVTCEIQVRTLMEEVWGEVDHLINYPHRNESVACTEQIRALARSTSSATRLVDAIFPTVADLEQQKGQLLPKSGAPNDDRSAPTLAGAPMSGPPPRRKQRTKR